VGALGLPRCCGRSDLPCGHRLEFVFVIGVIGIDTAEPKPYTLVIQSHWRERNIAQVLRDCLESGASSRWEAFIELAQPIIAAAVFKTITRWGSTDRSIADDLIQDTFARLCARDYRALHNFRGQDSTALCAYLRVIAASVTTDHFRAEHAPAVSLDDPDRAPPVADDSPSREIERHLLLDRIDKCLAAQKERDRRIFWLYHRQGFTPKSIAALPAIEMGVSGIETLLYRLTKLVADCMKNSGYFRAPVEGGSA
jgi:RNA polymerase sigma factor (sigma-70 family)